MLSIYCLICCLYLVLYIVSYCVPAAVAHLSSFQGNCLATSQYLLSGSLQSQAVPIVLVRPYRELPTCGLADGKGKIRKSDSGSLVFTFLLSDLVL